MEGCSLLGNEVASYPGPYVRGRTGERDKGLVPVVRACVEFYQDSSKIVFFGIFWYTDLM